MAEYREDARSVVPIDERPQGRAALEAMLINDAGVLLLARRDRLARDPYIAGHAKRAVALAGGRIRYVEGGNGDDDSAMLLDDIQHALAAHERRTIVARLKAGRDAKATRHPGRGRTEAGFRPDIAERAPSSPSSPRRPRRSGGSFELVRSGMSLQRTAEAMAPKSGAGGTQTR